MYIFPYEGDISFDKHLNVVVFPAPLVPKKPKISPDSKLNEIFFTASILLQHLS